MDSRIKAFMGLLLEGMLETYLQAKKEIWRDKVAESLIPVLEAMISEAVSQGLSGVYGFSSGLGAGMQLAGAGQEGETYYLHQEVAEFRALIIHTISAMKSLEGLIASGRAAKLDR